MLHEDIELKIDYETLGIKHDTSVPVLTTYILKRLVLLKCYLKRPCILICPCG